MEEEILDLVDDNDNVIGTIKRSESDKKGFKNFRAINIMIFTYDNKILVPKRSSNRILYPNCYDFSVGGHVASLESYEEAAYRELEEELGITGVTLEEIAYFNPNTSGTACFSKLYKLVYDEKDLKYDKDGIDEIFYMTLDEIQKLIEKDRTKFKGDYPVILNWMIEHKII